jgi:hypothetical protein
VKSFTVLQPFIPAAIEQPAITLGGCVNVFTSRSLFQNGRRNSAIAALGLSALLLVSCGGDDDADPTEAPAATTAPEATEAPTEAESSPTAGDLATPAEDEATPMAGADDDDASPVVNLNDDEATPEASPAGSPEASPVT